MKAGTRRKLLGSVMGVAYLEDSPAAIPRTQAEVKEMVQGKVFREETRAIAILRERGSGAGDIFGKFYLNRGLIKAVLTELSEERRWQTTFCSSVCGTLFKHFEDGVLLLTVCRLRTLGDEGGVWRQETVYIIC